MKKVYFYLTAIAAATIACANVSNAQTTILALKPPASAVVIDGGGQEWGDSLSYYNPEKKVHYTLSNDKTNLYLVVKTNDPAQQANILTSGITFTIDTKGRKRSSYVTTFPFSAQISIPVTSQKLAGETTEQKSLRARLTRLKKIAVSGFKDIDEEEVTTTNTYGINVAMGYDEKGYLVYEEAIPLALFHAGDLIKNDWAFNIKLNAIESNNDSAPVPSTTTDAGLGSRGSGGRGGSRGGVSSTAFPKTDVPKVPTSPAIDFWGKFSLASTQ